MTDQNTDWNASWTILRGLWPEWAPNDIEARYAEDAFRGLNQVWFREAIRRARMRYASSKPKTKWLMDMFQMVEQEERDAATRRNDGSEYERRVAECRAWLEEQRQEAKRLRGEAPAGFETAICKPAEGDA